MTHLLLVSVISIIVYMSVIFLIALLKKDNSIADIAWGLGFILIAAITFFLGKGTSARQILLNSLVLAWGSRLAVHIFMRNRTRGEDYRYARWRKQWGRWFIPRSYLQVFLLQGLLLLVIVYPIILINHSEEEGLKFLDVLGATIWLLGFFVETVGDYQLLLFKRNPENRGKIMTRGLWAYSRHPNYFGEATMWWGIFFIALSTGHGWTAIASPLLITFLLLRVSGVVLLEKKQTGNPGFVEYARKKNAFIPWFPKK
jgi:steroid 5-alpha reductase family enzyme